MILTIINAILIILIISISYLICHVWIKSKLYKSYGRIGNISDEFRSKKLDVVYLWVNMDDPKWRLKKGIPPMDEPIDPNNYRELEFSAKSTINYMKDILGTIYIVTDDQIPDWLENYEHKDKIQIVDHKDIIPSKFLPCFNAIVIETFIQNIPNISDWFIYVNDDMFINEKVTHDTFFVSDNVARFCGCDGIIFTNTIVNQIMQHNSVTASRCHSWDIYRKVDVPSDPYYAIKGHTPNVINRQILTNLVNKYWTYIDKYASQYSRTNTDMLITQFIYLQYMYDNKMGVYSDDYSYEYIDYWTDIKKNQKQFDKIDNNKPTFFVVNERHTQKNITDNQKITKSLVAWLDSRSK
jgi:hypothetical protein